MALFATHPIQYQAPWFRALVSTGVDLRVFFSLLPTPSQQGIGFGGEFRWDVPLTEGYAWSVLPQRRRNPRLGSFAGLWSGGIRRALAEFSPDVVLLTGWHAFPLLEAACIAARLGIPRIVRGESNALGPRSLSKKLGHRVLMTLYNAFVSVGRANRAFYEACGVRPERIFDGGYFVDSGLFEKMVERDEPHRPELRKGWSIPERATCFLFAGKLERKKRPLDFIEALGIAASHLGPGAVHGLVVGSGELEGEMRARVASGGLPVTFTGFLNQTEIGRAYASADAVVLPSGFGETWGLVVNEGMLFGLPAIVSDRVGCGPDLVTSGETGLVFPFGDAAALAERMGDLVDGERRRRMGAAARERVALYSPVRGAEAVLEAAHAVMQARC